jgi:dTDP-4-dehydrorhamnose reductase
MSRPGILVTGANGQLGKSLRSLQSGFPAFEFNFLTKEDLPIQNARLVNEYFKEHRPAFCINAAAYTAVDKAETDKEAAFSVNRDAVGNLAMSGKMYGTKLLHVSTDYVFDGTSSDPYKETSAVKPLSTYGESKLQGEQIAVENDPSSIIIRTAWVYSEHGNNFVKTMIRLMKEKKEINVVSDQVGAPTYAGDLAAVIFDIVTRSYTSSQTWVPGIYHYSNKGRISWYDFASTIKDLTGSTCQVNPIPTTQYPTPAKRPSFSLLNTDKISKTFNINIPEWKDSLQVCLEHLKSQ